MIQDTSLFSSNALPVSRSSRLNVRFYCASGATGTVYIRSLQSTPRGDIVQSLEHIVPTFALNPNRVIIPITDNRLLSVSIYTADTGTFPGDIFCTLSIQEGDVPNSDNVQIICSGYISSGFVINFPISQPVPQFSGPGSNKSFNVSDAGGGVEIAGIAPGNQLTSLIGGRFIFITSAAVAVRTVVFIIASSSGPPLFITSRTTQLAGISRTYFLWSGDNIPADSATLCYLAIPANYTDLGLILSTQTTNLQAGDEFQTISFNTLRWVYPL